MVIRDDFCQPRRLLAERLADEHDRRAMFDGNVDVEDGQIKVKRGMRRKAIGNGGREDFRAPVDVADCRLMRQHDPFRLSCGAGRIENVGQIAGRREVGLGRLSRLG